ncbi:MAG: hypothetical protein MO846_06490 [Candidatus Devosia symbiotica]|nr:hypothetical protein [Candidatus Devosia symbiotica]
MLLAIGEQLRAAGTRAEAHGLAAAHIGYIAPLAVISLADPSAARDYLVLFNPVVLSATETLAFWLEGSVSNARN